MTIESIADKAVTFSVPLRLQFRSSANRVGVVFQGTKGWGEFAPFENYDDELAGRWLAGALEMAFGQLPETMRSKVPVNAIVPDTDEITAYELVQSAAVNQGISTIKVKVASPGQRLADDIARVRAVRSALTDAGVSEGLIRLDANAGWSIEDALRSIPPLIDAANGLDYVEQPCFTLAEVQQVRELLGVRIAVDEGLRLAEDLDVLAIQDAADVVVVKPIPLGGIARSLRIIDRLGIPAVVSGSMDTSIGLHSSIYLAACVPQLYGACGLGTGSLLALDLVSETEQPSRGTLPVSRQVPDSDCLAIAHALTSKRDHDYWRERIVNAWYASAQHIVSPDVKQAVLSW